MPKKWITLLFIFTGFIQFSYSTQMKKGKLIKPYKLTTTLISPEEWGEIKNTTFTDSNLAIEFHLSTNCLKLVLRNKTPESFSLLWDESSFTIPQCAQPKIVHSALPYELRQKSLEPSEITANKDTTFWVAPVCRTDWNPKTKQWRSYPLIGGNPEDFVNMTIQITLIVDKGMESVKYPFTFRIKEVVYE